MTTLEKAISWMEDSVARGDKYSQPKRWGEYTSDCSSWLIKAWEAAGLPVKLPGANTANTIYRSFTPCGFRDVTKEVNRQTGEGMKKGDVLLNTSTCKHAATYYGDGKIIEMGGRAGDHCGISKFYSMPWNYVLRYEGE